MKIKDGDLLDYFAGRESFKLEAIAHVCNCQGVMGSGVALAIKTRYPQAYTAYKAAEKHSIDSFGGPPFLKLGSTSRAEIRPDKVIFNLHAQMNYGTDRNRYLDYEALYTSLEVVCDTMCFSGLSTLGVPYKMGSDRAGGDWKVVSAMLESVFEKHGIKVTAFKL